MPFSPSLDICFEDCSTIRFVDTTGVYNATTNTGGWEDTVSGSDVDTAIITVLDSDGDTVFTYTVTSEVPSTVVGTYAFTDYTPASTLSFADGEYTLKYTITLDNAGVYEYTGSFLKTCTFECCIKKLLATVPDKICDNRCDEAYVDDVLTVTAMFYAYQCAAVCEKDLIKTEINKRLTRFCDLQCD